MGCSYKIHSQNSIKNDRKNTVSLHFKYNPVIARAAALSWQPCTFLLTCSTFLLSATLSWQSQHFLICCNTFLAALKLGERVTPEITSHFLPVLPMLSVSPILHVFPMLPVLLTNYLSASLLLVDPTSPFPVHPVSLLPACPAEQFHAK